VWIHNRTPTNTARRWMTPYEFIHGEAPDISNLRIWGCKTYVRRPRDSLRKDLGDTTKTGYLVGYSETLLEYRVYIAELRTKMISVHCIFDEVIPDRESEYFQQIDQMYTDVETQNSQQEEFEYLIDTRHIDHEDGLEYVVTRVGKLRGDVVA
jgi:hypothetical protein